MVSARFALIHLPRLCAHFFVCDDENLYSRYVTHQLLHIPLHTKNQNDIGSLPAEEVQQNHVQAQQITYEYVNAESLCTFYLSLFSDNFFVFVRFQALVFV